MGRGKGRGKGKTDLLKPPPGKPQDERWQRSKQYSLQQQRNAKMGIKGAGVPPGKPLLEPPDFTDSKIPHDIVLTVDGKKLYAHKALLSLFSPFFNDLLSGTDMKDMTIENSKAPHVIELLRVIYPPSKDDEITGMLLLINRK